MKKLTKEEATALLATSHGAINPSILEIKNLEVGESLLIEKDEWKRKTSVGMFCSQYGIRWGVKYSCIKVEQGWVITRKS